MRDATKIPKNCSTRKIKHVLESQKQMRIFEFYIRNLYLLNLINKNSQKWSLHHPGKIQVTGR